MRNYRIIFLSFIMVIIFSNCDRTEVNSELNWDDFLGNYYGEYNYEFYDDNTNYWYIVNRKATLIKISEDTIQTVFSDTLFNSVAVYFTQRNPFIDTIFYKDISLDSLILYSYEVDYVGTTEPGKIYGAHRIFNEELELTSGIIGVKYLNNEEIKQSIHIGFEKYMPVGSNSTDSSEAVFYRGFR